MTNKHGVTLFFTDSRTVRTRDAQDRPLEELVSGPTATSMGRSGATRADNNLGRGGNGQVVTGSSAGPGPGMLRNLLAAFPTGSGRYVYWPAVGPAGTTVFRSDMQSKGEPEQVGGPYPIGPQSYHHFDTTASHWRLFQTERKPAQLDSRSRQGAGNDQGAELTQEQIRNAIEALVQLQQSEAFFGDPRLNAEFFARRIAGGGDGALGVSSRTWEQGGKNDDRGEGGAQPDDVGAVSWVGGRQHSTGYSIKTSDAAHKGALAAQLVQRRVSGLERINKMNAAAWARS